MQIHTASFDSIYHSTQRAGSYNSGDYVLHNVDVFNRIIIDSVAFDAVYQTAQSYINNDYKTPSAKLALSADGGTSDLLMKVDEMTDSDFDNAEHAAYYLEEVSDLHSAIDTVEKLREVYDALNENRPSIIDYLEDHSDDLNDYSEDESTGLLEAIG